MRRPLLATLERTARKAQRSVFNSPHAATIVTDRVVGWLLTWNARGAPGAYIARQASNEARRLKALRPSVLATQAGIFRRTGLAIVPRHCIDVAALVEHRKSEAARKRKARGVA